MSMSYSEGAITADLSDHSHGGSSHEPAPGVISASERARWATLESLPSPVVVVDERNTVRWANAAWMRAVAERGGRAADAVGVSFAQAFGRGMGCPPDAVDAARDGLRGALSPARRIAEFEITSHPRGGEGWFSVTIAPCTVGDARGAVVQMLEITDVRQSERRRSIARAVARAMGRDDARDEMLRDVITEVCAVMNWSLAARWTWDRAAQNLRCEAVYSQRPDGSRGWGALNNQQGLASRVWRSRNALWSDGLEREDAAVARTVLRARSEELIEAVGVPVGREGRIDGVVVFYSAHGHRPDAHFIDVLSSLFTGGQWTPALASAPREARIEAKRQGRESAPSIVELAASSRCPLLLTGERGVGKSRVAREIHQASERNGGPIVECDCTTLSGRDFDGAMFGYEAGSAPGSDRARRGLVEQAAGGTLVLRDVGALDLAAQSKLIKLLETRAYFRVGGTRALIPDVRVIATSATDLRGAAHRKFFSEELLQRLSALVLTLPPLRERTSELGDLALSVLADLGREYDRPTPDLAPEAIEHLRAHSWSGNLRELRTVLERAWLGLGTSVSADAVASAIRSLQATAPVEVAAPVAQPRPVAPKAPPPRPVVAATPVEAAATVEIARQAPTALLNAIDPTTLTLADVERAHIERVLIQTGFNIRRAATALDISRSTLYLRTKHYKIDLTDARRATHAGAESDNDNDHDLGEEHDQTVATGT